VATGPLEQQAYDLGRALGEADAVVIMAGLGGVMAAAARGCREGRVEHAV
jgi:predicted Rossmann-fold nucleotide-binding protein